MLLAMPGIKRDVKMLAIPATHPAAQGAAPLSRGDQDPIAQLISELDYQVIVERHLLIPSRESVPEISKKIGIASALKR